MDIDVSTYAVLTAENIYRNLGVNLSPVQLERIIADRTVYFRQLLDLPARSAYALLVLETCLELKNFADDELWNITAFRIANADNLEEKTDTSAAGVLENLQDTFNSYNDAFTQCKDAAKSEQAAVVETTKSELDEWRTLQSEHAEQLVTILQDVGQVLPAEFQQKLAARLVTGGTDVALADNVLAVLTDEQKSSETERSVIITLLESDVLDVGDLPRILDAISDKTGAIEGIKRERARQLIERCRELRTGIENNTTAIIQLGNDSKQLGETTHDYRSRYIKQKVDNATIIAELEKIDSLSELPTSATLGTKS